MKQLLLCLTILAFLIPVETFAEEMTGRQIVGLVKERHAVKNDSADVIMLIIDKKGNKKQRLLKRYLKKFENGLTRSLIVFREPKDIAGTAILTWELDGGQSKQWLYLPGKRKLQRMASNGLKSYFMGTDLTYGDLMPDKIDDYNYTLTGEETLDGNVCYVIEVTPGTKEKAIVTGYSKRIVFVRKDILFTVKIDFYDRRGTLLKTQTSHDLEKLEGDTWTAKKTMIIRHKKNHKTLMGIKDREVDIVLEDTVFTENFILSGKYLQ